MLARTALYAIVTLVAALFVAAPSTHADVIVNFVGKVVLVEGDTSKALMEVGDTFSGSFSYDPADTSGATTIGVGTRYPSAFRSFHVEVNGVVIQSVTFDLVTGVSDAKFSFLEVNVADRQPPQPLDDFTQSFIFENASQTVIDFISPDADFLSDTSMPSPFPLGWVLAPPNPVVTDVASGLRAWTGDPDNFNSRFHGLLTSIDVVPEPGTLGILAIGGLAMLRRRL